jgi:hypothetical protein
VLNALRRLFGTSAGGSPAGADESAAVEYKGYRIVPQPTSASGGYLTAGLIVLETPEGGRREHRFVRADTHPSLDDAKAFTVAKAQRLIDEQGERLFQA